MHERMQFFSTDEGWKRGLAYKPEPTDVFIVTPPKCGTTWMQQIVHGLRTRGSMDFDEISSVVPWINMAHDLGMDIYAPQVADPKAFKTHSTLDEVPKGGKYIAVDVIPVMHSSQTTILWEKCFSIKTQSAWKNLHAKTISRIAMSINIFSHSGNSARTRMFWHYATRT
jgi:hypothetical protein